MVMDAFYACCRYIWNFCCTLLETSVLTHTGIQQFTAVFLNEYSRHMSVLVDITDGLLIMNTADSCLLSGMLLPGALTNTADGCLCEHC